VPRIVGLDDLSRNSPGKDDALVPVHSKGRMVIMVEAPRSTQTARLAGS
jgi:hypothetical protein